MPVAEQPSEKVELSSWRRRAWLNLAKGTLWAALFVYVVYLVLSWNQSTDSFSIIPHFPASSAFRRLLMPLWLYLQGLVGFALSALSRPTYILGHSYPHGVWFYFPVLFLLKSQLAFLLLLALTSIVTIVLKARSTEGVSVVASGMDMHWRSVWVSLIVFAAACLLSRLDISIRHFAIALALTVLLLAPLPRLLSSLSGSFPRLAVAGAGLTMTLAVASLITALRVYPNYFPFVNALSLGRAPDQLVNDSNVDWNQSLPEAERFARQHAIREVLLDEYGFSDPAAYVSEARLWDCQQPAPADGGKWAILSANYIRDAGDCGWLMQYPHESLAAGSLYAVRLPERIPAAGEVGGPPLPKDYRNFGGAPFDVRPIFLKCIRDPQQLQPTMDAFQSMAQVQGKNNK
jgi:hypothetical protein